jgi:cell division protein FtsW (lipid II flippase)
MRLSRADRSRVADWWFTVDHVLVGAILALVGVGLILSLAASPAVAIRKGLPTYYFVERHLFFSAVGVLIMLAVSLFSPRGVRRLALFAVALLAWSPCTSWPGDQRGTALAVDRWPFDPTIGVRQAGLRDPVGVAVCRE